MGKEIVYCGGCGKSLREEEFARRKAHTVDNRPYCVACKPLPAAPPAMPKPAPPPPPPRDPAPASLGTTRRSAAVRPTSSSRGLLIGGAAAVVIALLLLVLAFTGDSARPDPAPPVSGAPPAPSPRKPAPPTLPPAAPLADLEALVAASGDPDAVLQKCDELRPSVKGTPNEARLNAIEQRALEARKARDHDRRVARSIEDARRMIGQADAVERREEISRLLAATREIAGPRQGEIDRLAADLQKKIADAEAAARNAPPPPPPPPPSAPPAVVSLTLINADTDQPVAGFDPIPAQAVINLATIGTRNVNVRANVSAVKPGSVRFDLNGALYSIKDMAPYSLAGKDAENYRPWTPPPGPLTITATPFSLPKGAGAAGTALTVPVQIVDPTAVEEAALSFQDGVSPTPAYAGTRDTEFDESHPQQPAGTARKLEMEGDIAGQGKDRWAVFRWDLTSIPPGRAVRDASLTFVVVGSGSSASFPLFELKRDWGEKGSTWLLAMPGKPWETPGAQGAQDRGGQIGSLQARKLGPVTIPLDPAVVQGWIDRPASNFGFIMGNSETHDALQVFSRDALTPADRPKLTITFHPARRVHASENFNQGHGKFKGGDVADGVLTLTKAGAVIERPVPAPISPKVTVRFKAKPLFGITTFEILAPSKRSSANCWYHVRGLKTNEWNTVEFRLADMREGYQGKGPSVEGDDLGFIKLYFDDGGPEARVLIDDFEILE